MTATTERPILKPKAMSLHEQAEWVRQWNASRPKVTLDDIPLDKGHWPILKGARR